MSDPCLIRHGELRQPVQITRQKNIISLYRAGPAALVSPRIFYWLQ